jgi:capsular polysaccharide biosynthesis protein
VIYRFLETFFRHKWLILLPPLLIPLIVGPLAIMNAPSYYESSAGVWVDRAQYLQSNESVNIYLSPAQNQINRLGDLLRTRAFLMAIIGRTPLGPLAATEAGERAVRDAFIKGFSVFPSGDRVVTVRFRSSNPQLSVQMVNAVIETFKEQLATDRINQAVIATSFYESRLKTAEDELGKANEALRRYLAANPRLTTIDPERGAASTTAARLGLPASAIDPQMAELLRQQDTQQGEVERLRSALEQARLSSSAALEGQEVGFQVVDQAQMPTQLTRERRKALLVPVAGVVVGAGLSAILLVLLVASDRAVRSEQDLLSIARVVGTVPQLRLKKSSGKGKDGVGPDGTRRAIGFPAGSFLPAATGARA